MSGISKSKHIFKINLFLVGPVKTYPYISYPRSFDKGYELSYETEATHPLSEAAGLQ